MVEATAQMFKQFETIPTLVKVKAHTGIRLNEEADKQAKFATEIKAETDISPYKTQRDQELDYHLYHNKVRLDRYPRTFIKETIAKKNNKEHRNRLVVKHKDIIGSETVNIRETNRVATAALERDNHLDHINHREHSFILNTLAENLQTADKMIKYKYMDLDTDQCIYCDRRGIEALDDNKHFWKCPETDRTKAAIRTNSITRLVRWEIKGERHLSPAQARILVDKIGISHREYFNKAISRGIITQQKIKQAKKQGISKNELTYATSCLLIATCQEAWNPRAAYYQQTTKENKQRKEQQERAERSNRKNQLRQAEKQRKAALKVLKRKRKRTHAPSNTLPKPNGEEIRQTESEQSSTEESNAIRYKPKRKKSKLFRSPTPETEQETTHVKPPANDQQQRYSTPNIEAHHEERQRNREHDQQQRESTGETTDSEPEEDNDISIMFEAAQPRGESDGEGSEEETTNPNKKLTTRTIGQPSLRKQSIIYYTGKENTRINETRQIKYNHHFPALTQHYSKHPHTSSIDEERSLYSKAEEATLQQHQKAQRNPTYTETEEEKKKHTEEEEDQDDNSDMDTEMWEYEELEDERDMGDSHSKESNQLWEEQNVEGLTNGPKEQETEKDKQEATPEDSKEKESGVEAQQQPPDNTDMGKSLFTSKNFRYKKINQPNNQQKQVTTRNNTIGTKKANVKVLIKNKSIIPPNPNNSQAMETVAEGKKTTPRRAAIRITIPRKEKEGQPTSKGHTTNTDKQENNKEDIAQTPTPITRTTRDTRKRRTPEDNIGDHTERTKRPKRRKDHTSYSEDPG